MPPTTALSIAPPPWDNARAPQPQAPQERDEAQALHAVLRLIGILRKDQTCTPDQLIRVKALIAEHLEAPKG